MSDFGGYGALAKEAAAEQKALREKPLVDCPLCGEVLDFNEKRGLVNCPLGHFRARRSAVPAGP